MTWDLSSYFPSFGGPEHAGFAAALERDLSSTVEEAARLDTLAPSTFGAWERVAVAYEDLTTRRSHLQAYTECLCASDAADARYRKAESELSLLGAEAEKLAVELRRALGAASDADFEAWCAREAVAPIRYPLRRLRTQARQSMPAALEGLAADLGVDGLSAWGRLYDKVAGTLSFELRLPERPVESVPMARRRSLMNDPDRTLRKAAFEGGNRVWADAARVLGPALNHIAGTRLTLNARRGVEHFLDVALFQSAISRATLDAMWTAVEHRRDVPQRALALKARALGLPKLDWYDLEAPLPIPSPRPYDFAQGSELVRRAFNRVYPKLGSFFDSALAARWVDWEPGENKLPGAFCTWSPLNEEPRVFMTFAGSVGDVSTLAHEVGHAFHATMFGGLRPLLATSPMTLAETASTFAQQLLASSLLGDPEVDPSTRLLLLGTVVNEAAAFLLDIPTRFAFEHAFHEERTKGEVSVSRLSELMLDAQKRIFGPHLGEGDPLFWASKPHFYAVEVTFYNFPYTFGYLLSRGLFAALEREGEGFLDRYEALLRATGQADAHEVVKSVTGFDLETPGFWETAIASLEPALDQLESLLASGAAR